MKKYFITATGTGIGKTLLTCALAWQLRAQGQKVKVLKPVMSGFDSAEALQSDAGQILQSQGLPLTEANIAALAPWRFKAPLSPDMAAEDEGRQIDFDELVAFSQAPADADFLLVEGIGGVMTPLNTSHTVLDWMAALKYPVILVSGSYLGSLTHSLTAAQAIHSRGLPLRVVISESEDSAVPPERARDTLQPLLGHKIPIVRRLDHATEVWKYVSDLESIMA